MTPLVSEYTKWERPDRQAAKVTACDVVGNCATDLGAPLAVGRLVGADAAAAAPIPLGGEVLIPTQNEHVAGTDSLRVLIEADAPASIKRIVVTLDGAVAAERTCDLGTATTHQEVIEIAVSGEGDHQVGVSIEDWNGDIDTSVPIDFFFDTSDPVVTLDSTDVGVGDTWGIGTDMIRLSGGVIDGGTVASVQVKINDDPWGNASFETGEWRSAVHVPGVDGETLRVQVRAVDLAGRVGQTSNSSAVDLAPDAGYVRPDSTVISGPTGPSSMTARFEFGTM